MNFNTYFQQEMEKSKVKALKHKRKPARFKRTKPGVLNKSGDHYFDQSKFKQSHGTDMAFPTSQTYKVAG